MSENSNFAICCVHQSIVDPAQVQVIQPFANGLLSGASVSTSLSDFEFTTPSYKSSDWLIDYEIYVMLHCTNKSQNQSINLLCMLSIYGRGLQ